MITDIAQLIQELPDPDTKDFLEKRVEVIDSLGGNVDKLESIAFKDDVDIDNKFKAFQLLAHIHRRKLNFSALNILLDRGESQFFRYKLYNFYRTQYLDYDSKQKSRSNLLQDIFITKEYIKIYPDYIGFKAHFAGIAIRLLINYSDDTNAKLAETYLRACMSARPRYAHYHFLLGKLYGAMERTEDGISEIRTAIDYEDSESQLYYLRIQEYNSELLRLESVAYFKKTNIEAGSNIMEIRQMAEQLKSDVEEAGRKNIEFAGIFTLVISFLFLSIQSALNRPLKEAIILIGFMGLISLCLFSGIKILFYGRSGRIIAINFLVLFLAFALIIGIISIQGVHSTQPVPKN